MPSSPHLEMKVGELRDAEVLLISPQGETWHVPRTVLPADIKSGDAITVYFTRNGTLTETHAKQLLNELLHHD